MACLYKSMKDHAGAFAVAQAAVLKRAWIVCWPLSSCWCDKPDFRTESGERGTASASACRRCYRAPPCPSLIA
jgi:hypothetical protein